VFFFKGNIEDFMIELDMDLYNDVETWAAENGFGESKPVRIHEYVPRLLSKSPTSLDSTIKPLLNYAFSVEERPF
jgi:hypothetical protein